MEYLIVGSVGVVELGVGCSGSNLRTSDRLGLN